nr:MAG TPA: hypothetical protein [Caudoviricetes sp.]
MLNLSTTFLNFFIILYKLHNISRFHSYYI